MAVIAGLFDSEADATQAMDRLLREGIEDLETHVISGGGGNQDTVGPNVIFPVIPNTSGTPTGMGQAAFPMVTGGAGDFGWFDDMDEVESAFYHEGMRDGATLALAKVDDDADVQRVRLIFTTFMGRTYVKD